jgi:heterodisulfide reductase subunit C
MAEEMGALPPHAVLRLVQLEQWPRVLGAESLWLCLTCETCSARCPNGVHPARIIDALRELALRANPKAPPRSIRSFHRAFLEQIRSNGRVFEFGLIGRYKMLSGALLTDIMAAPGMLVRGKLSFRPQRVRGIDDVRRMFDASLLAGIPGEDGQSPRASEPGNEGAPALPPGATEEEPDEVEADES